MFGIYMIAKYVILASGADDVRSEAHFLQYLCVHNEDIKW